MKEYIVEIKMTAWAKVPVVARNEEEAIDTAYDKVDFDDAYDWEIEGGKIV